jgi:hypothetical protein
MLQACNLEKRKIMTSKKPDTDHQMSFIVWLIEVCFSLVISFNSAEVE